MGYKYRAMGLANKAVNRVETKLQRSQMVSKPVVVDVVLTKACNFACKFCRDYETPTGSKRISKSNFEQLARQVFPTASRLNICSGGEPYLHNDLPDILRIAKKYELYTWLLSNGSVMKQERVESMLTEGLISEHGFSVDGFKADTVEGIRLNAKLPKILDNIRMVQRIRSENNLSDPKITIRYALMRSNIDELADAIRQWGDMGIENLECGYLSLANGLDRDLSMYYHQDLLERRFEEARTLAEQYPGLTLNLPDLIKDGKTSNPDPCTLPWDFIMIDSNGEVMPCYRAFEVMRMPSVYGDADSATPFKDIWNNEKYQQLRGTVNDDSSEKFFSYCETCENRCGWGREEVHLGDETWISSLQTSGKLIDIPINHERPLRGTALREFKEQGMTNPT